MSAPVGFDPAGFHPLQHSPWSAECSSLPGGRRRHAELWWRYVVSPALRRFSMCRVGRHDFAADWIDGPGAGPFLSACATCRHVVMP
jgi:hypothetical protein